MASKKTFYIVSDNIQTKSRDKTRIKEIAKAFQYIGHKTVIGNVSSNEHTKPKSYGCTKKNDVWVCIVGGACAGTIADMTGYTGFGNWFKNSQLKNAKLMFIFMSAPEGASVNIATTKKLGIAHDDSFSTKVKNFTGISNPANYLKNHQVTWIESGTTQGIVNLIKAKKFNGADLDIDGTNKNNEKEIDNSYEISKGFDSSKPFEGYLKIDYTVNDKNGKEKSIYIDWSSEAPSTSNKFDNDYSIIWKNNKKYIHEIDVLSKIKTAEKDYLNTNTSKYYLKKVSFIRDFEDIKDDIDTEENESLIYKNNDTSSYKMLLYDIGVFNGEQVKIETLGVCGKTLLDGIKNILEKTNYYFNIQYGNRREEDRINFTESTDESNIVYTFNEGYNGNIIGINNVNYSPINQLTNSNAVIYKSKKKENDSTLTYNFVKKSKMDEVFRYGEQMNIENLSNETSSSEATQISYDNLISNFKPTINFTVKTVGLPPIKINDWVETKTINPLLTNEYQVKSRKININVSDRPMIQTEYGLGDIDTNIKTKNNLANQRKKLIRAPFDLNEPISYNNDDDEFINVVWVN